MTRPTRLSWIVAAMAVSAAGACKLDETAGLARPLGDPLLDIAFGVASDGLLPTGTHTLSANTAHDTLTLTLRNLSPLPAGAVYQLYLADSSSVDVTTSQNLTPITGRLITSTRNRRLVNRDSSVLVTKVDTTASVTAIAAADTNQTFTVRIVDPRVAQNTHVVLAVAPAAVSAASHLDRTTKFGFLSSRYRSGTTFTTTGNLTFGSWAIDAAKRLPFSSSSATITGSFRGSTLRANIRDLVRPPQGFQYAGWLIDTRTGMAARLGVLQTPVPDNKPLTDADLGTGPFLTDVGILEAQLRGDTATAGNVKWEDFTRVVILLEPKGSAPPTRPGGAFVLGGQVPQSVSSRSPQAGKLFGTVTGGTTAQRTNATVYLTGAANPTPVGVANADAQGIFRFRTLPVGSYKAFLVPAGGTTPVDSESVVIGSHVVNGLAVGDSVNIALQIP